MMSWTALTTTRCRLTSFLLVAMVMLDACVAESLLGDGGDKTFRLARCRVRCLASLQVSQLNLQFPSPLALALSLIDSTQSLLLLHHSFVFNLVCILF